MAQDLSSGVLAYYVHVIVGLHSTEGGRVNEEEMERGSKSGNNHIGKFLGAF